MKSLSTSLLCCGAVSAVLMLPSLAWAEDDSIEPPMRYPPASVRPKLIVGGLAIASVGYGAGLLSASLWPDLPGISDMRIPVAGPWMSLSKIECPKDDPDCGASLYLRGILTVADGLLQLGGLAISVEGLFLQTEADAPAQASKVPQFTLRPAPIVTGTVTGIGFVGTF